MFGKGIGIGGEPYGRFRRPRHGAVVAMLAGNIKKGRQHDIRTLGAIGAYEPLDGFLLTPVGKGTVTILGETEVVDGIVWTMAEPMHVTIENARSFFHLTAADHAERTTTFRAKRILPAFAACRTGDHHPYTKSEPQIGHQAALLIVRVRTRMHQRDSRAQPA